MISFVKGPLVELYEDMAVIDTGGVGLEIHVPVSVMEKLPAIGGEVIFYTYFQVREDAMCLYGFLSRQDLLMFKQLISVNGIGPKAALGILSALTPDDLRSAIVSADAKAIARAPGVGNKTAQRIILDLKDKIGTEYLLTAQEDDGIAAGGQTGGVAGEAVQALIALGYSPSEAGRAVRKVEIGENMTVEDVLKASLKHLAFL